MNIKLNGFKENVKCIRSVQESVLLRWSNLCLRGFTTIDEYDRSTPGKPLGDENWSEVILTPGKIDIASWKAGRTTITSSY